MKSTKFEKTKKHIVETVDNYCSPAENFIFAAPCRTDAETSQAQTFDLKTKRIIITRLRKTNFVKNTYRGISTNFWKTIDILPEKWKKKCFNVILDNLLSLQPGEGVMEHREKSRTEFNFNSRQEYQTSKIFRVKNTKQDKTGGILLTGLRCVFLRAQDLGEGGIYYHDFPNAHHYEKNPSQGIWLKRKPGRGTPSTIPDVQNKEPRIFIQVVISIDYRCVDKNRIVKLRGKLCVIG